MAKPATQDNVINLPTVPPIADWHEKAKERDKREAKSAIIKAAVGAARGAIRGGHEADHTGNGLVAQWSTTAGTNYEEVADQALIKLTKLTHQAKRIEFVELWSLSSVVKRIQDDAPNVSLDEWEWAFIEAFTRAIASLCQQRYNDEWRAGRSA
jgi:hypothetical protein